MPDKLNGLFFSEILADNAGNRAFNTNGDGAIDKQDEFVEIQNNTSGTINLDGYQIWSNKNGLLHTFDSASTIDPGGTATVVGTYVNPPTGIYSANGNNASASGRNDFLEDGEGQRFDTLYLVVPNGDYIQLSYGQPPQAPGGLPTGFPTGGTMQGVGESISSNVPNGIAVLRDANGNLIEGSPTPGTSGPVCFASGTVITTDQGPRPVDELTPGTLVLTMDHGVVPLRSIRTSTIGRTVLGWNPDLHAVIVPTGVFGNWKPLRLSPAHRILIEDPHAELFFDDAQVFVPARQMVGHAGIHIDTTPAPITYHHLLFDSHEIVQSDGCWSESLFLGDTACDALTLSAGWRTQPGFDLDRMSHETTARRVLKGFEVSLLLTALAQTSKLSQSLAA